MDWPEGLRIKGVRALDFMFGELGECGLLFTACIHLIHTLCAYSIRQEQSIFK